MKPTISKKAKKAKYFPNKKPKILHSKQFDSDRNLYNHFIIERAEPKKAISYNISSKLIDGVRVISDVVTDI